MAPRAASSRAQQFAKRYVDLVEALQQQGVPEKRAREEARLTATLILLIPDYADPSEPCPTCGRER